MYDKLRELNIPKKIADEFVRDIMGFHTGDIYQKGLVDCVSVSEFDQQLARLEVVWNEREKPFSGASDPRFYHNFKQYKADAVRYNMLTGVREAAGMGSPPSILYSLLIQDPAMLHLPDSAPHKASHILLRHSEPYP